MSTCPLKCSLNDAEILANYAVRNNITGVQEAISGIAMASENLDNGDLKGDKQREFYANYSTLASRIWPVSVASLKDSLDEYGVEVRNWFGLGRKHKLSRAGIVGRRQSFIATFVLFVLVVVQSYWLIGNTLLLAAPARTDAEMEALRRAESDIELYAYPNEILTLISAEEKDRVSAANLLVARFKRQDAHRKDVIEMLAHWTFNRMAIDPGKTPIEMEAMFDKVTTLCGRILDVLQQYVLPLLYGLLGAMAYVIRTISQQARDRLYRVENETGYYLRIWLGILSGLAIGWFFKPGSEGVGSLSPLALAFVAGYSADLLFTAMDRLVGAFSAPEKKEELPEPAVKK
jgi:hypothetical protein